MTTDPSRFFLSVADGVRFSGLRYRGEGPTVVLIPGSFAGADYYDSLVGHLAEDLDLVIPEMRGHGMSTPPLDQGSMATLTADTLFVADHLEIERFFVGGASIGGMIAIDALRVCPERILGVISIEGWSSAWVEAATFRDAPRRPGLHDRKVVRDRQRAAALSGWTDDQIREFGAIWRRWNGYEILARCSTPVLEIWGDRGTQRPSRDRMLIPDRPNIELAWIRGAFHTPVIDRPREVADVMNEFIHRNVHGADTVPSTLDAPHVDE